ncbi:MAG: lipocalin-like domain-containing protein [Undibacterium umbellatum]|uniref:lipocalin-like domain-containing protein n=1 Tax=Undibacterium umbellatum TaxID=2762300 RepID=UPI003BB62120
MNNTFNKMVCMVLSYIALLSPPAHAFMEQDIDKHMQAQKRLTGTWKLTAAPEIRADGSQSASFGNNPHGLLIIDENGYYSLQIYKSIRSKFASGDKRKGTEAEYRAAAIGTSSHYGRCFIDTERNVLVFRIEHASLPNWDGSEQTSQFELKGDELTYRVPASASGNSIAAISSWKRLR